MRGMVVAGVAAGVVVLAPRVRGATWNEWLTKVAWSWAGVPSGPLGWVSSHWVMPRLHGPIYPVMAGALELRPEDELLEVACGSGVFLAQHGAHVGYVAGLDLSDLQIDLADDAWPSASRPAQRRSSKGMPPSSPGKTNASAW